MSEHGSQVEEVKRALARLAAEEPTARSRVVVEIGSEAVRDVERAAAFADADGRARLARAVELAERTDDRHLARDGQRALAAFEWFRHAASDTDDHFRNGHGMDLLEETKRGDR